MYTEEIKTKIRSLWERINKREQEILDYRENPNEIEKVRIQSNLNSTKKFFNQNSGKLNNDSQDKFRKLFKVLQDGLLLENDFSEFRTQKDGFKKEIEKIIQKEKKSEHKKTGMLLTIKKIWSKIWKVTVSIGILGSALAVLFFPVLPGDCSLWSRYILKYCDVQQLTVEPQLEISNIFIDYLDDKQLKIEEFNIDSIVDLSAVNSLSIYFTLKNVGDSTLVFTVNKVSVKTSEDGIVEDPAPEYFGSKVLSKNNSTVLRYTTAVKSAFLLEKLRQNHGLKIIIEPDIVYFEKEKPENEKKFDSVIQCGNNLSKELLPQYKAACNVTYLEN